MASSSTVERSVDKVEASLERLRYLLRNSPFEVCEKVVDGVSSSSSGSKCKEAKLRKENEIPDPLKRCLFCKEEGHDVSYCTVILETQRDAADPPLPECEMCRGEHDVVKCPSLREYRPAFQRFDGEDKFIYIKNGVTYKESPEEIEYLSPYTCSNCFRVHTSLCPRCPICYEQHCYRGRCLYYSDVPKGAIVSPYYIVMCWYCEFEVDSSLWCTRCGGEVKACVTDRPDCIVCGRPFSAICCPYGKHIADKFRESHPQLQSEFI
ncbi:hypothetical protein ACHQM5_004960 [Ranunculus cassubicifolius]